MKTTMIKQMDHLAAFAVLRREARDVIAVADYFSDHGVRVFGAVFGSNVSFGELLAKLRHRAPRERLSVAGDGPVIVTAHLPSRDLTAVRAYLWPDPVSNLVYVLSTAPRDGFDALVVLLQRYLVPHLSTVFLRTPDFYDGMRTIGRTLPSGAIRVLEFVSRTLIDDPESFKRVSTQRRWTDEAYESTFEKLAQEKAWLSSLRFEVRADCSTRGKIYRSGQFACDRGFAFFFDTVVSAFNVAIRQNRDFFSNRGRESSSTGFPKPMTISYSDEVFGDERQAKRLLQVLEQLPDSELRQSHSSGYFQASVLDYLDGSSFELWVPSPRQMLIMPMLRATTNSVSRLCNQILEEFEEGSLLEFVPNAA